MSEETTTRPWEVRQDNMGSWWVADMGGRRVCYVGHESDERAEGDARLIVEAVNAMSATATVPTLVCADCGAEITETRFRDGTVWSSELLARRGQRKYDRVLCMQHFRLADEARGRAARLDARAWDTE